VTLSPRQAEIFFDRLFSAPEIQREFKNTEVTIEQSKEALDRIFDELRLTKLQILVKRPNPDGPESAEAILERVLNQQKARQYQMELTAERGKELQPSPQTRALAEVAVSNGFVEAEGTDNSNHKVTLNTKDHPVQRIFAFDYVKAFADWLVERAAELIKYL
jgi:uncharacterized protein DUF4747